MCEKVFWIGKDIDNKNNNIEELKKKINLKIKHFSTPEDAFTCLSNEIKKYNFKLIYAIINGELADKFYYLYREKINEINTLIASIIICPNIYEHINKNYINDSFFNPGGITDDIQVVKNYINYIHNYKITNLSREYQNLSKFGGGKYEKMFEKIYKLKDKIVPALKEEFMEKYMKDIYINEFELYDFQKLLLTNYPDISNYIRYIYPPNEKCIKVPLDIIAKYFLYLYTLDSEFYRDMNRILTFDQGKDIYKIYINILYKSLYNNKFKRYSETELYRGSIMNKNEFEQINEIFSSLPKDKENKILVHSKNFLSFSKNMEIANNFVGDTIEEKIKDIKNGKFIVYKFFLSKKKTPDFLANNIEIDKNNTAFPGEEEVLFLPFSCFLINDIVKDAETWSKQIEGKNEEIKIHHIKLEYLDVKQKEIKEKKNQIKFSQEIKESFEKAFLNNIGKELYLFFGDNIIKEFEKFIKEKAGIIIKVEYPKNIVYGDPVIEEFHPENQIKPKEKNDKNDIIELDEVIYNVEEKDIDKEGYVNILGKEFIKVNDNKISLIINGKEEKLCQKYKLKKGNNKIKFIFKEAITNFSYLFYECTSLSNIAALKNWKVSNATNLTSLFYGCTSLKNVNGLKNWDVSNVNHFSYLFYNCQSLTDISGLKFWNVKKGIFFSCLFSKCTSLEDINPLQNWDVSNGFFFNHLFYGCTSLKDISGLENWNVSNGNYFDHLFYNCESLSDITPLKDWDVSKGINFSYCFYNCDSLTNISSVKNWNIRNGQNFISMFSDNIINETKPSWFYKST